MKKHFLYIGYLVPRKNIKLLLLAVEKLSKTRNDFVLDIVGDGESRQELENFIKDHQLTEFIQMHGFRQKEELPAFLARATAFLFQTDFDIWGLTLNESMAAGLPCLCSVNAGAATDLVIEGETGWIVDYRNTGQVTEKLNYLLDHPEEAQRMGKNAKLKIESTATLALSAAGFIEAIKISETKKR
jgi:glycosyltransferase involved in cell wall biosynthesis